MREAPTGETGRSLSRRGALGAIGSGVPAVAGCLNGESASGDGSSGGEAARNDGSSGQRPEDVVVGDPSKIHYVSSASEMNEALRSLPNTGGYVKWIPGSYTGEDFTEMVEIPTDMKHRGVTTTLDMRSVDIEIGEDAPYRGEDGAFFYKPQDHTSHRVNILGPHRLRILAPFDDIDPRNGKIYEDEGEEDDPFNGDNPDPHVFYLWHVRNCRVAPVVTARYVDRILYFRQNADCGHHTFTNGFRSWGGNVALQVSDGRDDCGKDRCHWYGQIGGFLEAGVFLAGKAKSNRVWAQVEGHNDDADEHVASYKIHNQMNSLMLTHIVGEEKGHLFDIQARNCGIFAPCTDGNPQPFKHARLGVRPSNIYKPNYTASVYDMGTDYRPLLRTVENGNSSVDYDEREGEVTLRGADDAAALQTPGPAGRMGHHLHGYADARFVGDSGAGMADGVFRVGAWADGDNHAMLTYDPRRDNPLGATVQSGGERLDDTGNGFPENVDLPGTAGAAAWIAYVRADYQAFFYNYQLVYESWHDLTGWPRDPRFRVDARTLGGEATGRVRRLEYGDAAKAEGAEMYIAGRGDEQDDTIERPWRSDDIQVG